MPWINSAICVMPWINGAIISVMTWIIAPYPSKDAWIWLLARIVRLLVLDGVIPEVNFLALVIDPGEFHLSAGNPGGIQ